jgi:putative transposase
MTLTKQCNLLCLNRSSLYIKNKETDIEEVIILKMLSNLYLTHPFYGYRKVSIWLQMQGYKMNKKRVRRYLKLINWRTIYREPRTTIAIKEHKKYPYLLKNLEITEKNQVWATDISYIPMEKGFMYLSAIIDLHTRYVLSWDVSNTMSAEWCTEVLQKAIDKYGKPSIFNTDQGSQYTSDIHTKTLIENKIAISMDGKGRAIDNIFIERLWRSVKYENVYLQSYTDGVSLYKGLDEYFRFYNNERYHQSLNYKTPNEMYYPNSAA